MQSVSVALHLASFAQHYVCEFHPYPPMHSDYCIVFHCINFIWPFAHCIIGGSHWEHNDCRLTFKPDSGSWRLPPLLFPSLEYCSACLPCARGAQGHSLEIVMWIGDHLDGTHESPVKVSIQTLRIW